MRADIQHLISSMSELEIVDTFNAIERHLLGELQACAFLTYGDSSIFFSFGYSNF